MNSVVIITAKTLILGDSGVGKSGLVHRLQDDVFKLTASTHGASLYRISVPHQLLGADRSASLIGELELWDLAGQPDYNVVHQIFMQGANAALVVIDESQEDALSSVVYWVDLLKRNCPDLHAKFLVSARVDRGVIQSETSFQELAKALGFKAFIRTSAKTGEGISAVRAALLDAINWSLLPRTVMPARWHSLHDAIRRLAAKPRPLLTVAEIQDQLDDETLAPEEIETVLKRMHDKGEVFVIHPRQDTTLVLLQPDALNRYASSIVLAARTNAQGPGVVDEATILRADIDLRGLNRLSAAAERLILDAAVELLVGSGACYRKDGKLVFPSQRSSQGMKCFLSHNWADKPVAEELGKRLLDNGIDVWLDKWEILAGESLTSKIEEGIDRATAFIILMSPNSMKAKWVREELRIAIQRRLKDPDFALIPILLQDCEIPAFLRDYVYVDWRSPSEEMFEFLLNSIKRLRAKPQRDI